MKLTDKILLSTLGLIMLTIFVVLLVHTSAVSSGILLMGR